MAEMLNEEKFETAVLKSQKPVMLDFSAAWCAPCRALYPSSILSAPTHVFLVGWGDARPGQPAEDVGCLGAHLWMAWSAASTPAQAETIRGSWTAFLKGYREATAGLWDGPQRELAALCFGLEVLACAGGSTQERGALRDLEQHDPRRTHAVQAATASLLGDAPDAWFEGLPWEPLSFVEADLVDGVRAVGLSEFAGLHTLAPDLQRRHGERGQRRPPDGDAVEHADRLEQPSFTDLLVN